MRSIRPAVVILVSLIGCGDDSGTSPEDARIIDDDGAEPDSPPTPSGCDYAELHDEDNDDVTQAGTPEVTGVTLMASGAKVICGTVSPDHFDTGTVDVDGYALQLPAGPVFITLSGTGLETLGEAKLGVYSGKDFLTIEAEEVLVGAHGVVMLNLPAGAYEFALLADNNAAITAPLDYKIRVTVDNPAARCPRISGATNHAEGTTNNDTISIVYTGGTVIALSPGAGDAPEASGITLLPSVNAKITGNIAATGQVGEYKDPDTYAFATGPGVDELTIRLNWTGAGDLDWFLFKEAVPDVGRSAKNFDVEDEMLTIPVLPNTTYWLFTGMFEDSTAPKAYDLSLCGTTFVAP